MNEIFMQQALQLARLGQGKVSPNPMVGALLVRDNHVVSEGWHQEFGGPHAEVHAIKNFKGNLQEVTLYSTLEPCCHRHKKTPPCTDLIISSGIRKVVIGSLDPNPSVSGNGVKALVDAGVEVIHGVLAKECHDLNEAFWINQTEQRPYIHIKIAQSLNGMLSPQNNRAGQISNEQAQTWLHQTRYEYDAVMIGRGTLNIDNPLLSIRKHPEQKTKDLYKIILGNPDEMNFDSRLFTEPQNLGKVVFLTSKNTTISQKTQDTIERMQVRILRFENSITQTYAELLKMGIGKILIEAGPKLFNTIIESNVYDELTVIVAPKIFSTGAQLFVGQNLDLSTASMELLGNNLKITKLRSNSCSLA